MDAKDSSLVLAHTLLKPDFAWRARKVVVFVEGCFWHGCSRKYFPRTNTAFWRNKIETNKRRDRRASQSLRRDEADPE
jgi:DNA mismatch endonuclease (patch repair protein)